MKTLDRKLSRIRSGSFTPADFVMADAGDPARRRGVFTAGGSPFREAPLW